MKKLILKTALITFGITLILAVSAFGIVSFCAPATMMRFFDTLGLHNISGDYAYQEYQNSRDLSYLARAFEVAAENRSDLVAEDRFEELYGEDGSEEREAFARFCDEQTNVGLPDEAPRYGYRAYLCGRAACVKYRLAQTEDEKDAVCSFALSETSDAFSQDSPVIALTLEAIGAKDADFCSLLLARVKGTARLDGESEHYLNVIKFLEEAANE